MHRDLERSRLRGDPELDYVEMGSSLIDPEPRYLDKSSYTLLLLLGKHAHPDAEEEFFSGSNTHSCFEGPNGKLEPYRGYPTCDRDCRRPDADAAYRSQY